MNAVGQFKNNHAWPKMSLATNEVILQK